MLSNIFYPIISKVGSLYSHLMNFSGRSQAKILRK